MRKTMIRNTLFMLLVTAVFAGALLLYLRSASSLTVGEAGNASGSSSAAGDSYTASATGYSSDVTVTATYADGVLTALTVDASGETPQVGGAAATKIAEAILAAGSADGIDAMANATITSDAIFAALADCANQAGLGAAPEPTAEPITAIEDWPVTPGADEHSASATGFASDISVTVEYVDGVILSVSIDAAGETEDIGGAAASDLAAAIAIAGSAHEVDAIAGATITSNAVLAAVRSVEDALLLSECDLYTGTATGFSSNVTVTAGYKDGVLRMLTADASGETAQVGGTAADKLVAEVLDAGNADSVDIDAYANATITTEAFLEAFAACEEQVS